MEYGAILIAINAIKECSDIKIVKKLLISLIDTTIKADQSEYNDLTRRIARMERVGDDDWKIIVERIEKANALIEQQKEDRHNKENEISINENSSKLYEGKFNSERERENLKNNKRKAPRNWILSIITLRIVVVIGMVWLIIAVKIADSYRVWAVGDFIIYGALPVSILWGILWIVRSMISNKKN
jgi:hypothetical protein